MTLWQEDSVWIELHAGYDTQAMSQLSEIRDFDQCYNIPS